MDDQLLENFIKLLLEEEKPTPFPLLKKKERDRKKETFDIDIFKNISYNEKFSYLQKTLKLIGQGSSRAVFKLDEVNAIKLAINKAGIDQNKAELEVCDPSKNMDLFPITKEFAKNFEWIVVELAEPMTFEKFEHLTNMTWIDYMGGMIGIFDEDASSRHIEMGQILSKKSKFFNRIVNLVKSCDYMVGDLLNLVSWGIIKDRAVIVDSGFTNQVYKAHYLK